MDADGSLSSASPLSSSLKTTTAALTADVTAAATRTERGSSAKATMAAEPADVPAEMALRNRAFDSFMGEIFHAAPHYRRPHDAAAPTM